MMSKWRLGIRTHWPKFALVFVVFALMVWVSHVYVSAMLRDQLRTTANQNLLTVEANVRTRLREPEAMLVAATVSLRDHLNDGNRPAMQAYMARFTRWLIEHAEYAAGFNGLYGWVDGAYLDGTGWVPPEDYVAVERPWYRAGEAGKGQIGVTDPYVDAQTREVVVTYAQELSDDRNVPRGVVSIDVLLRRVGGYVTSVKLSDDGYSMLVSKNGTILAHDDPDRVGDSLRDLSPDFARLEAGLAAASDVSERRVMDTPNGPSVVFVKRLYNGWYICMVASEKAYYDKVWTMAQVLILVGLVFALILSAILVRLSLAQISADEANRVKTLFLARMSHDIRTPMNAIIGISELVLHEPISQVVRAYMADVKQAGRNLLSLINDILDFSKIESGKMELNEAEYDLSSLIYDLAMLIKIRIAEAPLNFSVFVDSRLPSMLVGDKARIQQILLNLLTNAVKYTPKGEVSLSVEGREIGGSDEGGHEIGIVCEVRDSGIGIKPEDMKRLFSDFSRFDAKTNTGVEGTGLGLAIARNLALMMGGDITVRSEYGKGSLFTASFRQKFRTGIRFARVENAAEKAVLIYEPRRKASTWILRTLQNLDVYAEHVNTQEAFESALEKRHYDFVFSWRFLTENVTRALTSRGLDTVAVVLDAKPSELLPPGTRALMLPAYALLVANVLNGEPDDRHASSVVETDTRFMLPDVKVLIVDDIDVNLRVAKGLFARYEMQIDCALSGAEAIHLAQKNRYDLIFMDHMMPQMDGIEATSRLRALGGEFETLPIVALTANAVSGMREMFLASGFSDFLSKPIEVNKLNDVLERWIPKARRVKRASKDETQPAWTQTQSEPETPIASIAGVDVALGLSRIGGKAKDYLEMLAAFVRSMEERLEALDPNGDIKTFTIHVHALKSAAANIGASAVSAEAAALEAAGMANDRAAIAERWEHFAAALAALTANIRASLRETQAENAADDPTAQTAPEAYEILAQLKIAIRELEIDGIDAALERLRRVPLDARWREQTAAIANMALLARFDEALVAIEALENGQKRL
jgi:signal transduction histidine kinase/DNA-binding response OmpR family regulator